MYVNVYSLFYIDVICRIDFVFVTLQEPKQGVLTSHSLTTYIALPPMAGRGSIG